MKYLQIIFFAGLLLASCGTPQNDSKVIASDEAENKIEVIDFHTTHRCKTCLKIEDNTRKLLNDVFKEEMESGKMSFYTVNVDDKANEEISTRFQAAGTALFINVIKDGLEEHIDLTDFAFLKAFDDEEFSSELEAKLKEKLKTL